MKKQFFNRITSVLLALVMVLSLIPMTALGVYAEEADVDLSADTIVIDSVADWNAVAAASADTDFTGKVIKLGDNIAFGETAAPVLFAGTFKGEFYGNGKTVSGKTLAGDNLIAVTVDGGTISGDDAEGSGNKMTITGVEDTPAAVGGGMVANTIQDGAKIRNIIVKKCVLDSTNANNAAMLVGNAINSATGMDTRISNCIVEECTFSVKTHGGAILGNLNDTKSAPVTIEHCTVKATTLNAANGGAVAAIVGKLNDKSHAAVDSCTVASDVSVYGAKKQNWAHAVGMVVGQAGAAISNNVMGASNGSLSVKNCNVAGTIKTPAGASSVGGVVGAVGLKGECILSNNTVNVVYDGMNQGNLSIGGVLGVYIGGGTLYISECTVVGSMTDNKTSQGSPRVGSILGYGQGTNSGTSTIEKCYGRVDMAMPNAAYGRVGGIVGAWNTASSTLNIKDCYYEGSLTATHTAGVVAEYASASGTNTVNAENVVVVSDVEKVFVKRKADKAVSGSVATATDCYTTALADASGFITVSENLINGLVKKDGDKVVYVRDYVNSNLVQLAKLEGGKYAVRFIGTSIFEDVSVAAMEVVVGDRSFAKGNATAYDKLVAYGESDAITEIKSEDFGAEKFFAIVIENIPADALEGVVFTISLSITVGEGDGAEIHEATFTGTIPPAALV